MNTLTTRFKVTFELTITSDRAAQLEAVHQVINAANEESFKYMPPRAKAIVGLIAQAASDHGNEFAGAELLRQNFLPQFNELLRKELNSVDSKVQAKVSPARVEHLI